MLLDHVMSLGNEILLRHELGILLPTLYSCYMLHIISLFSVFCSLITNVYCVFT